PPAAPETLSTITELPPGPPPVGRLETRMPLWYSEPVPPVCRALAVASPSVDTACALASAGAPGRPRAVAACPPVASAVAVALSAPDVSAFAYAVAIAPLAQPPVFTPAP